MEPSSSTQSSKLSPLQILAWAATLLLSILPDVLFQEITGSRPAWLYGAKLGLIAILLMLGLFWEPAKKLQKYFMVFLAIFLTERAWQAIADSPQWRTWFPTTGTGFLFQMFSIQLGRLGIAISMIALLFVIGFQRKEFFLGFGNLFAPSSPMQAVGVDRPSNWRSLGLRLSIYAFLAMLAILVVFTLLSGTHIDWGILNTLLPAMPVIVLLAAMNSFSEEITYRAALLAPIHRILGAGQAILLAATFFGIGHYYGVPSGFMGVLATGYFGWILGRGLLETKGLFWPWFIHLWADVVIFSFLALGALQAGG
jgi:membrane protease YdiL (CAAX protease family)